MSDTKRPIDMAADHVREHLPGIPVYVHGGGRSMVSIVEFLTARLDAYERDAQLMPSEPDGYGTHAHCIDKAEALSDIAAKRAIIALWTETAPPWSDAYMQAVHETLTDDVLPHLASVYSDHPDYREEWAV